MTPREIVLEQINHRETAQVPYTLAFEDEVGPRLDEHYGGDAWRERIVPYITQCGSVARGPSEEIDDAHHRDAFGTVWRTDVLPTAVVEPGLKVPSFKNYAFPLAEDFLDLEAKAAVKKRVEQSPDAFTMVSPTICLWQSWYVRGFETTLMDCAAEEDFYAELLDKFTDLSVALIEACGDIPADGVFMGDDWGDQRGVLIGPERWRKLFKPRYARIFQAIHDQDKLAVMHCCGSSADIQEDIIEIGLDVLESVQPEAGGMNPYELKQQWGDRITYWGCLGSQSTIPFGTPDEIRAEIRRLREEMSKGGGYILAPAKPLRPETPIENAVAVVEEFLGAE
jgi:uroporphyrinogen decarboxylase